MKALHPFLLILVLTNCGDTHNPKQQHGVLSVDNAQPSTSTKVMIENVKSAVSKINAMDVPYILNTKKAAILREKAENTSGFQKTTLSFSYALEMLKAGKTDEAISVLHQVLTEAMALNAEDPIKIKKKEDIVFVVKKQLALAYLREAEIRNCIAHHNNESCIIPISKKAQHMLRSGAENAIILLDELVSIRPNDYDCLYLLNIAHMTLGQYPESVPMAYRIPEAYFKASKAFPKFSDIAMDLGVGINQNAGGTCIDDFNNDGYLDIIASSWGFDNQIRYFENNKEGGFTDKSSGTGLTGVTGGLNLRHADFNNDGHLDFLILRGAWLGEMGKIPNSLIKNNGDGTFTDVTMASGIYSLHPTQTAIWSDFNLDGWLDLFIANESTAESSNPCELFLNNADGTFTNVFKDSGILELGYFKGIAVGDVDNDRYPDIYLSNYQGENVLYMNSGGKNGNISFTKGNREVQLPERSFSTWMFDYDNDGHEDIFVSGYSTDTMTAAAIMMDNIKTGSTINRPYLYKNNGDGSFTDVALKVGLTEPVATMGCNFGDLDNDGYLDFYLATGDPEFFSIVPNRMYRNNNGNDFEDVTYSGGFGHIKKGHAIGFGDLDLDGDQDIYAVMGGAFDGDVYQNLLFENPVGNTNNWIHILLEGVGSNRFGIGAKLILTLLEQGGKRKIYHTVGTGASFGGNSLMAEIGLGKTERIDMLEIHWPNHKQSSSIFYNIGVNQIIKIREDKEKIVKVELKPIQFRSNKHPHE